MKKNEYLQKMLEEVSDSEREMNKWEETRKAIAKTTNYNEEALAKWDEEKPEWKYTSGQIAALRAWNYAHNNEGYVEFNDWFRSDEEAQEAKDFVETLKAAGVKKFVVTSQSTALMRTIHALLEVGCKIRGHKVLHEGREGSIGGVREELALVFSIKEEKAKEEKVEEPVVEEVKEEKKPTSRRRTKKEEVAA